MATNTFYGEFEDGKVYEWKMAVSKLGRGGEPFLKHAVATGLKIYAKGELKFFSGFHFRMWLEEHAGPENE